MLFNIRAAITNFDEKHFVGRRKRTFVVYILMMFIIVNLCNRLSYIPQSVVIKIFISKIRLQQSIHFIQFEPYSVIPEIYCNQFLINVSR